MYICIIIKIIVMTNEEIKSFIGFLKIRGCYSKYMHILKNSRMWVGINNNFLLNHLSVVNYDRVFPFEFSTTKEGYDFWCGIRREWNDIAYNLQSSRYHMSKEMMDRIIKELNEYMKHMKKTKYMLDLRGQEMTFCRNYDDEITTSLFEIY